MLSVNEKKEIKMLHRRKVRYAKQLILVEGPNAVKEALSASLPCHLLCLANDLCLLPWAGVPQDKIRFCSEEEMTALSTTKTGYGVCGIFSMPPEEKSLPPGDVLYLDHIQDPGNAGTLIRSACAFGFSAVLFSPGSVDPFSPKVIRSSAGMIFSVPVFREEFSRQALISGGRFLLLAEMNAPPMEAYASRKEILLVLGNEGHGIEKTIAEKAGGHCGVLMEPAAESLNVAVAGSILMARRYALKKESL
jgi:TrmH family RNA methyltransferase